MNNPADKLIVALDYPSLQPALDIVSVIKDYGTAFKVGLELFVAEGPIALEKLREAGASRIFLDLKFHDIPNTMAGAIRSAAAMGVWMLNVHASAGSEALKRSAEVAKSASCSAGVTPPLVIAVTVLTSIGSDVLCGELGVTRPIQDQVISLAKIAQEAGLNGVVAPAADAGLIRHACGDAFAVVTPGIRPEGADINDQSRISTPAGAISNGASYLVVGRPITSADDPSAACMSIIEEIRTALTA